MNSQQLGQQPIFIWMCYGILKQTCTRKRSLQTEKCFLLTATLYNLLAGSASQIPVKIRLILTPDDFHQPYTGQDRTIFFIKIAALLPFTFYVIFNGLNRPGSLNKINGKGARKLSLYGP